MTRRTRAIARREVAAFLAAPVAGVVAVLFLVVQGFAFFAVLRVASDPRRPAPYGAVLRGYFGGTFLYWAFLFFIAAVLTMRLVAEERRAGTWEALRTVPASEVEIVVGKWLGALGAYVALWLPTLGHVAVLYVVAPPGASPDPGPIATAYLGVVVTGASALAIGLLASALTRNVVAAAVLAFVALLVLLLVGLLPELAHETAARHPTLAAVAQALDLRRQMDDFARGIVDTRHLAVHAGLTFVALLAATAAIAAERSPRLALPGAVGVVLGATAALLAGVVVARHPARLDATRARVYSLDARTRQILADVRAPVEALVLQGGQPEFADLYDEVRELLRRFQAAAPLLDIESLDPAVDPGRVQTLAGELVLSPDELAGGGAVVLRAGGRQRAVALLDMASFGVGEGGGRLTEFHGEEALASALLEVTDPDRPVVCVTTGHGELPLEEADDGADLARLAAALARDQIELRPLAARDDVPRSCAALAVFGARQPFAPAEARAIEAYLDQGGRLLVALADGAAGLETTLEREGIQTRAATVVDPDAELGAPGVWGTLNGYGHHPISAAFQGRRMTVWHQPRWIEPLAVPGVATQALVRCSPTGWAAIRLDALRPPSAPGDGDVRGPQAVAVASERAAAGARAVAFGAARSFTSAEVARTSAANDALAVSAVAWLVGRDKLVGVGPKTPEQVKLVISAAAERRLFFLLVLGIPALAALAAVAAALARRRAA